MYLVQVAEGGAILVRPDGHVGWRCLQPPAAPQEGFGASEPSAPQQQPVDAAGEGPHYLVLRVALSHLLCTTVPAAGV